MIASVSKWAVVCLVALAAVGAPARAEAAVERWGRFELKLDGPASGNPFVEVELSATFSHGDRSVRVAGFYDGEGAYRVRFMPGEVGVWRYQTQSNRLEL